jgi:LacI family transcriptional regulator
MQNGVAPGHDVATRATGRRDVATRAATSRDVATRAATSRDVATSHDVARLAGVSQPTVSRALRDDPRVAEPTRARVRDAAATLAYVPSRRGRSLATRATGQVAVVVQELGNPFYAETVEHLHAALERLELRALVLTDQRDVSPSADRLLDGGVDGAILASALLGDTLPSELAERGLPVVLFNRALDEPVVDACVSANAAGAVAVADELLRLGHADVGAILGPRETSTGRDRERALRAALAEGGAPLDAARVRHGEFSFQAGYAAFGELMAARRRPTAVFCANDVIAIGALNAARTLGVDVPGDVTVFGFDDIAMAAWDVFRLSTVRQDLPRMARAAAALLAERRDDPALPPRRIEVPARMVLRGTHGPPRATPRGASPTRAS